MQLEQLLNEFDVSLEELELIEEEVEAIVAQGVGVSGGSGICGGSC